MLRKLYLVFGFIYFVNTSIMVNSLDSRIIFPDRTLIKFDTGDPITRSRHKSFGAVCYEEGGEGKCLPIRKCPEIRDLISSRGGIRSSGTADLLRKRICSYDSTEAYLCCLNDTEIVHNPILPTLDECGIPYVPRIVRGENFTHGTHPWLVGIGYKKASSAIKVECGGTLITKRHVITAAHCFVRNPNAKHKKPQLTHVILGEHSLSQEIERKPPIVLRIVDRKNTGYDSSAYYKDIELLVLEKDVVFTKYIQPACLPFKEHVKHFDLEKNKITIAGWGKTSSFDATGTDTPKQAFVSKIPSTKCQEAYKNIKGVLIDHTQICFGGEGKDTCGGDSGGPAIYEDNSMFYRHFLIGITAFGGVCGHPLYPGVYTYVPAYTDWIVKNL